MSRRSISSVGGEHSHLTSGEGCCLGCLLVVAHNVGVLDIVEHFRRGVIDEGDAR